MEDLHFQFLVTFHTAFPELHLKVTSFVHQCLWECLTPFTGQIEFLSIEKIEVHSSQRRCSTKLVFWQNFSNACEVFFGQSPIHSVSIEQLIWHYFFLVSCHGWNVPGVCLSYQLTKKKHFSTSVFCSSYWTLNLMLSTNVITFCYSMFQGCVLTAVLKSVYF